MVSGGERRERKSDGERRERRSGGERKEWISGGERRERISGSIGVHRVAEKGGEWVGITTRRAKCTAKFSQLINYSLVGVVN